MRAEDRQARMVVGVAALFIVGHLLRIGVVLKEAKILLSLLGTFLKSLLRFLIKPILIQKQRSSVKGNFSFYRPRVAAADLQTAFKREI